jgi:hypothetical protein
VRPFVVVITDELRQHRVQVPLAHHDHVVEALGPEGSDNPLGDRVRARRSDRGSDARDTDLGQTSIDVVSVDGIAIVEEVTGLPTPGRRLHQLPPNPRRRRARCDVEVDQLPASVPDEEEDLEGLETDRLNHEEVGRPDALELVGQEGAPTLSVRLPVRPAPAVAPDRAVADDDAELEQLSPDTLGSPQRVVARNDGDQLADLGSKPEAAPAAARPPGPVEPPALAVPADNRVWPND